MDKAICSVLMNGPPNLYTYLKIPWTAQITWTAHITWNMCLLHVHLYYVPTALTSHNMHK